jgi:cytochrome c oxidase subunit 2
LRRETIARTLVTALALTFVTSCSAQPLPLGATVQSHALRGMWTIFFWSGIGVAVIIYGLIGWCLLRYRKRPSDATFPVQFRRNSAWEIVYTGVPILMVIGLFMITYPAERHVETIAPRQAVVVNVTAFRWSWKFDYPELGASVAGTAHDPPIFEIPIDETARFNVTSVDVDHSFWVPAFLFKRDAIPGLQNVFDWTPTKLGDFRGECGEFCGLDHATMSFQLHVVTRSDFERWIAARRRLALSMRGATR